jgi:molybdate transport system ATP-binding protein
VLAVTPLGNRLRVGLALPEPLVAEVTAPAAEKLALAPGARVLAAWKATATRLVPR